MYLLTYTPQKHTPWNKGKLVGQKPPLKLKEIWAIRIRLQIANRIRDLALFNLAIDSKLRSCDLVKLRIRDVTTEIPFPKGQWSCNKKPSSQFNSRSRSKPGMPSQTG